MFTGTRSKVNPSFFLVKSREKRDTRNFLGIDYSTFGAPMAGRSYQSTSYRYGFNGKENDPETSTQNYGFRISDPRLGRFLSMDPLTKSFPWYTPYQFAGNKPIWAIDLDGLEEVFITDVANKNGTYTRFVVLNINATEEDKKNHTSQNTSPNGVVYSSVMGPEDIKLANNLYTYTGDNISERKYSWGFGRPISKAESAVPIGPAPSPAGPTGTTGPTGPTGTTGPTGPTGPTAKITPPPPPSSIPIEFYVNSFIIVGGAQALVKAQPLVDYMKKYPDVTITLSGNMWSDDIFRIEDVEELSYDEIMIERAKVVRNLLIVSGIKESRISVAAGVVAPNKSVGLSISVKANK